MNQTASKLHSISTFEMFVVKSNSYSVPRYDVRHQIEVQAQCSPRNSENVQLFN